MWIIEIFKNKNKKFNLFLVVTATLLSASCVSFMPKGIPECKTKCFSAHWFLKQTTRMSPKSRETTILQQVGSGNIPGFLRELKPVTTEARIGARSVRARFWVMPDYLAIGPAHDYLRIPMTPITAQKIASRFGFLLPTKKMVDLIYQQAEIRLRPRTMRPGPQMTSNFYYKLHNKFIKKQIPEGSFEDYLVAGHKKDVVITNRLLQKPGRVAIYGWHQRNGIPIQPLSTVHNKHYADYSHGIRLVYRFMTVNGKTLPVDKVMQDPVLWRLVSDEGPLRITSYKTQGFSDRSSH